ncbi:4-aminobutyrate aminotransferase, partial [human gut metagenome]
PNPFPNIKVSDFCLDYLEYIIENEGEIGAILLEPIRATDTHIAAHPIAGFSWV